MLKLLLNAEKEQKSQPHPSKSSAKFNKNLSFRLSKCSSAEEFKKIIEDYSKARKDHFFISEASYESLAIKTLE